MKTHLLSIFSLAVLLAVTSCVQKQQKEIKTDLPVMPIVAPYENTLEYEWSQKKVLDTKLLSDAEAITSWEHSGAYGAISLSTEKRHKGNASVMITSPTKGPSNPPGGRPWGVSGAFFKVNNEDWTDWNRISFWIYPDLPGFKVVSINTIFFNDGEDKVPGVKNGHNFQVLENQKWNKVYWEIAHLGREKVTGFVIQYRLQGNEPGAAEEIKYYVDEVYLEKVDADHFEGWDVQPNQIAYNHSGYAANLPKTALTPDPSVKTFSLINTSDNSVAFEGEVKAGSTGIGTFNVLDFSAFNTPGTYTLKAGNLQTKPFVINNFSTVYRNTIIKTINHFYTQRCGYLIEGIHDACHLDWLCHHGDLSVNIHGGWHDAGDVSQGLGNTSESATAMMELARKLEKTDPVLYERLLDEARWGTAWLMKTRFGDGYRATWSTKDMWTDDIIGNSDDYQSNASNSPQSNFMAAVTEANAAILFKAKDPFFSDYALKCAIEDFDFAAKADQPKMLVDLAGAGLNAAMVLYEATADEKYKTAAVKYADYIVSCQQQNDLDTDVALKGFFYRNSDKEAILHYPHRGFEHNVVTGLVKIARQFPDQANAWREALKLYAGYYKEITAHNAPYYMIPAGVYDLTKARNEEETEQIREGIRLNDRYYIKRFPVWGEFRGNSGTILTQAKGLADIANLLQDKELLNIVYHQLEWHLGKNPFAQSLMYGEGYRYAGQYSVMSGNLTGGLPVGVQTHFNRDLPYWPAENCHNWKEIWVLPSAIWLSLMCNFI
ncbi:glycoside hydrolase family 9 protein [Parabacteroides sp. PF5-9]|uniref:glycoside hydrolase family 9 protein n=1 Tax=Parabacteroides sp. PF5-9 TaxID=1742404 RepID=UPI002473C236|nr:glycoside hydrolase family 9 protein [Parabacteroides sp. PF5-9]MDH6358718.1 hypothetical protein [Parabacteroides sp. PF5-9]